jgi:hypothetical protein
MSFQRHGVAVRLFHKAMRAVAGLQSAVQALTPPPFRLIQIGAAFWQSRALYVCVRLDIATVLGDAELAAAEIAMRVGADADALRRLMRMLAAMGVFTETAPGRFRNNRLSRCLRRGDAHDVRAMILMHNSDFLGRPWVEELEQGVRRGVSPFRLAHGVDLFVYLDGNGEADRLFSQAMDSVAALAGDVFATDFAWDRFERVIDLGGSRGTKALAILQRHPHLAALVVDRPQVVAEAERHWAAHPAPGSDRLRFVAGDLLQSVPQACGAGDIYLLSAVLHGFDDDACVRVLGNLAKAIGNTGARVAVLEMVLPELGADMAGASFDMQMFIGTEGRERTLSEWTSLFGRSGLVLEQVVGTRSIGSILVGSTSARAGGTLAQ